MEVTGKILQISEVKQIKENYSIQEVLIETGDQYPKKIMLQINEKIRQYVLRMGIGATGTFKIDCESKESNGKWFTNIKCYAVNES